MTRPLEDDNAHGAPGSAGGPLEPLRTQLEAGSALGVRRALLGLTNVNAPDVRTGDRPLHLLVEHNHLDGIEQVLRRKADPNLANIYHRTPLHCAARMGHCEAMKRLLAAGADPNTVASDGNRPIFDAILYNQRQAALQLIEFARSIATSLNANLETPLHAVASTSGDPVIAQALVEAGSPIDGMDIDNNTALHLAVEHAHEPLVRLLLRARAHTSLVNRLGLTPDLMTPAFDERDITRAAMLVTHTRWVRQLQRFANNPSHLMLMGG